MSYRARLLVSFVALAGALFRPPVPVVAQDSPVRGPRFLVASADRPAAQPKVVKPDAVPALRRQIAVNLDGVTLEQALTAIAREGHLNLVYSRSVLALDTRVRLRADDINVAAALTVVLLDAGIDVLMRTDGQVVLLPRGGTPGRYAGTIVGRITDSATGVPLRGVEVSLKGTSFRALTGDSGHYELSFSGVPSGKYGVRARMLGYRPIERTVTIADTNAALTLDLVLPQAPARLQEVVSTATGRQRRLDIANDVTVIKADSVMQTAPVRSLADLLDTRVPGLTVQRTSGAPGDPARLRLRGASSPLRSNDPIVIVDGVRFYAEQSANRSLNLALSRNSEGVPAQIGTTPAYAAPSPLDYIDPNIIETIEVLKGPSAATMYGQDAANGVIVITTKKGRAGPPRWTASAEVGRTTIEGDFPELHLRWGHSLFSNAPVYCPANNRFGASVFDPGNRCIGDSIVTFQLLNDPALTVLDKGHRGLLTLGVSGGTQALTYSVTGTYGDEVGLIQLPGYEADRFQSLLGVSPPNWMRRPQDFKRWGMTSSIRAQLGSKGSASLTAQLTRNNQQKSSLQDQLSILMSTYLDRSTGTYYHLQGNDIQPVTNALNEYFERATAGATQFTTGVSAEFQPMSWVQLTADAGINLDQRSDQIYYPRGPYNARYDDTTGFVHDGQGTSVQSTVNLFGRATLPVGRGFTFRFASGVNYAARSTNDVSAGTRVLPPGASLQGAFSTFTYRAEENDATFGYFVEPSIGNQKFNFSSGLRLDGGSSYGANLGGLNLPTFPKLGFSYLVSDEPWFPFRGVFQSLRMRISYGAASRQPGPKDRLRLYGIPASVFADGKILTGVTLQTLGNVDVRPERTGGFEGGVDADLLDNRLNVTLTGYRQTTTDALAQVPVAPSVYGNFVTTFRNIGVTRNTGLEVTAGATVIRSGPLTWEAHFKMGQNRNVVVSLGPDAPPFNSYQRGGANATGSGGTLRVAPGYPLNGRWSRPIIGYSDANGDGFVQEQEIQLGDTAVYVGSTLPNYEASFGTTISLFRGTFTVDANFDYQDGLSQFNESASDLTIFSRGQQDPTASQSQQVATTRLSATDYNWIQTVNTFRFNSLSVRFSVPRGVARRVGAQTLSVALQGANLGLWTNYRGLDPNVNAFGNGNNMNDTGVLPQPRTWQLRFNATY